MIVDGGTLTPKPDLHTPPPLPQQLLGHMEHLLEHPTPFFSQEVFFTCVLAKQSHLETLRNAVWALRSIERRFIEASSAL